ncbi:hypothetical protein CAEBREN_16639 [Caenorhabditis brenneri]|uniref:Serine protease n=1 Tax=Caenorhabditis brenneri TaxID=135651 RepID=G0NE66_CAEBE|nr:hypothetical protein CAEBREN_16639 [Caenorhabditis brenneri]
MDQQFRNLEKLMYTLTDPETSDEHDCVFVIGKHHAVTYEEGDHSMLQIGEKGIIYNLLNKEIKLEVNVFYKNVETGILILETLNNHEFDYVPELTSYTIVPRPYHQLSIRQTDRTPLWNTGTLIRKSKGHAYYLGNTDGMLGDVIFDEYATFIGMVVTKREGNIFILKSSIICSNIQTAINEEISLTMPQPDNKPFQDQELVEQVESMIYTSTHPSSEFHRNVFAISKKQACTYAHGRDPLKQMDAVLKLYNAKTPGKHVKVKVTKIDKILDFVLMTCLDGYEFDVYPTATASPYRGQTYYFIGVNEHRKISWKRGVFSYKDHQQDSFFWGTTTALKGDSGGIIINANGHLLGMNTARLKFSDDPSETTEETIKRAAHHPAVSRILLQDGFMLSAQKSKNNIEFV